MRVISLILKYTPAFWSDEYPVWAMFKWKLLHKYGFSVRVTPFGAEFLLCCIWYKLIFICYKWFHSNSVWIFWYVQINKYLLLLRWSCHIQREQWIYLLTSCEQACLGLVLFLESHCVLFPNLLASDVFWPSLFLLMWFKDSLGK